MTCGECGARAMVYNGYPISDSSRYTYCSERRVGIIKTGIMKGCKAWTKVHKNSQPKWCPRKENLCQ